MAASAGDWNIPQVSYRGFYRDFYTEFYLLPGYCRGLDFFTVFFTGGFVGVLTGGFTGVLPFFLPGRGSYSCNGSRQALTAEHASPSYTIFPSTSPCRLEVFEVFLCIGF